MIYGRRGKAVTSSIDKSKEYEFFISTLFDPGNRTVMQTSKAMVQIPQYEIRKVTVRPVFREGRILK